MYIRCDVILTLRCFFDVTTFLSIIRQRLQAQDVELILMRRLIGPERFHNVASDPARARASARVTEHFLVSFRCLLAQLDTFSATKNH